MTRTVQCVVLKKEAEGMDYAPYPGELGQRIYDGVSKEAWQRWLGHQTMLINEYRLTPIEPEARKFLETEIWGPFIAGTMVRLPWEYRHYNGSQSCLPAPIVLIQVKTLSLNWQMYFQ